MKKVFSILVLVLTALSSQAKFIRFTVDMTDQVVNVAGVHLTGDFQAMLGLTGGDWQSNTLAMEQQADTNMYSVVLNLPAFRKYEYKFVNGDQFYQVEFVPVESRVGYDFNDNRWLFLDSLSTDTTFIGALKFGENAPAGLLLMRYLVDMQSEIVSNNGVHLAGSFNGWSSQANILYSFVDGIYEVITYAPAGMYGYNFLNGNDLTEVEVISDTCSNANGNREIDLQSHTVLPAVCYQSCTACEANNIAQVLPETSSVFPNPTDGISRFRFASGHVRAILFMDASGREVMSHALNGANECAFDFHVFKSGLYYARLIHFDGGTEIIKVLVR